MSAPHGECPPPSRPLAQRLRSFSYRTLLRRPLRSLAKPVDHPSLRAAFDAGKLHLYHPALLEQATRDLAAARGGLFPVAQKICALADEALDRGPFSVVDKTSLPVSGNPHDYWHPAPYYWPNPNTRDGIPYVKRDGERVPGTRLYEEASDRYDRSRLQRLFDDGTLLTLAWKISGRVHYAQHAARELVHWFVRPESRMSPHLQYAQIIMNSRRGKWSSAGIIETKDFYYYLDAVRLLRAGGALDSSDHERFLAWLREFRAWLLNSRHGGRECSKPNNHGLLYDLQLAAISAYLDDPAMLASIFRRVRIRLYQHFEPDGRQPYELVRTLSAHYCAFNLQGWANLARFAQNCGVDLWQVRSPDGRGLERGLAWLLDHLEPRHWPFRQISPFDWSRLVPLAHVSATHYKTGFLRAIDRRPDLAPPVCFHPHDGIPPAWQLTLNA